MPIAVKRITIELGGEAPTLNAVSGVTSEKGKEGLFETRSLLNEDPLLSAAVEALTTLLESDQADHLRTSVAMVVQEGGG